MLPGASYIGCALIAVAAVCLLPAFPQPPTLAIEGATIIMGTGDPPISDGVVLISGKRIHSLGKRGFVRVPDGTKRIEARGKWLIPGLIDMHVHMDEVIEPSEFLIFGVTSVRDVGSRLVRIQRIRARTERIPRIYWMGRNIDEGKPSWWGAVAAKNPEAVPRLIEGMDARGVDGVKLYTTAGPKTTEAVIREAHKRRLPVTGHLEATTIAAAARLGIDGLEHAATLFNQLGRKVPKRKTRLARPATAALDSAAAIGLVRLLASKSVSVTPTLVSSEMPWRGRQSAETVYAGWAQIPKAWSDYWGSEYWNFIKPVGWTEADYRTASEGVTNLRGMIARLREAGVPLVAGTDTPAPWVLPGAGLLRELELYTRCGLTPIEAIRTATGRAAWALKQEADVGTIRPGRYADFVLLDADPMKDIRNLRRISAVYQAGILIDLEPIRARLRAMKPPAR